MQKIRRQLARIVGVGLAALLLGFSLQARAGCGTIVTLNPTDHWVWITIYDVGENIHMDYGWVAPHAGRKWTGGASPLPYACGSYYHVRYEVKNGRGGTQPPGDAGNLFDTRMQINPQLTLSDLLGLLHSIGTILTCVTPGAEAGCAAEWGINEAGQAAIFGAVGSDSNNSVVCIKSSDDTHFWLDNSGNCALRPPSGRLPPKHADKYTFQPASRSIGIGVNQRVWYFNIALNGQPVHDDKVIQAGRFYTDDPGIAKFESPHGGHLRGVKKGKTMAHWDYKGKRQASAEVIVK